MKRGILGVLFILIIGILISGCAELSLSKKESCEESGGEYTKGVGDSGFFYYCKCPISKYETGAKTCSEITNDITDKCVGLSNEFIRCKNSVTYNVYYGEGVCECSIQNSNQKTYLTYQNMVECTCKCFEEDCNCMCPAYKN